ncbi:MAG: cytochrome c [Cytophagales bacterium]|jgi:mono/diheme cytochrome c family protein|nr:cytochrome c [Cytophagales bacterium]MCA6388490.1 cytochrome c [Cytophagales bacterium]MCA6390915.1 cytochrome c [Cytophagales bacterium]MCA6394860.1 cytochrome c [Cytophagales bacterium]MCA6399103.1 cytochrome c [Cytophagales bacterium]
MRLRKLSVVLAVVVLVAGCKAGGDYQGLEYAPNMYHSVAYEPLSQITDPMQGKITNALDNGRGEFYNSNQYNPYKMNLRLPPAHTVRRSATGWLPYRGVNDTTGLRLANKLKNPYDSTTAILSQGKAAYEMYCQHCHGAKGAGDGKVAVGVKIDGVEHSVYPGVANLKGDAYKNITEGHIFHVITYGKGLMGSHGSQVSEEDRWKIAKYVKGLQKN